MPKSASKALRKKLDCLLCTYNEKTDQTEYCLEHNADLIEIDGVLTMPIGASYKCPVTPAATRGKRGKYGSWLPINLQGRCGTSSGTGRWLATCSASPSATSSRNTACLGKRSRTRCARPRPA